MKKVKFELDEIELKNLHKFEDEMLLKHRCDGTFQFRFTPTGIGYIITVVRLESKEEKDITNYDNW